eukprot:358555-Chlamydomonas_euryale.AAC.3
MSVEACVWTLECGVEWFQPCHAVGAARRDGAPHRHGVRRSRDNTSSALGFDSPAPSVAFVAMDMSPGWTFVLVDGKAPAPCAFAETAEFICRVQRLPPSTESLVPQPHAQQKAPGRHLARVGGGALRGMEPSICGARRGPWLPALDADHPRGQQAMAATCRSQQSHGRRWTIGSQDTRSWCCTCHSCDMSWSMRG